MFKYFIIPLLLLLMVCGSDAHAQCADPLTDKCARITSIVDVDFGTDDFTGNEQLVDSVCVYTQADGDGRARVRNSGASTQLIADPRRFAVEDGMGNQIQMRVAFRGSVDTTWRNIRADTGYQNKARDVGEHPAEDQLCSIGGNTNDIRTLINRSWINGAIPGVYTGTVSIEVSPD